VKSACADGVDVLFENVGGEIMEAVLWNMRDYGRIALCGMISDYNLEEPQPGPKGMMLMIGRRLTMRGFIVTDHPEACEEYVGKAIGWLQEGKLKTRESVTEGVENAPQAFIDLLKGRNTGKQIVQLSESV
jgi:NADPH-dependent curcumin reductase CurA